MVLDTNALIADPDLSKGFYEFIEEAGDEVGVRLYVPAVVLEEFEAHVRRECHELIAKPLKKLLDARRTWLPLLQAPTIDVEANVTACVQRLKRRLLELRVLVLHLPKVAHSELLPRALSKASPFTIDGAGYVDALVWHSALELVAAEDGAVTFVSADGGFWSGDQLAPELLDDLKTRNAADRLDIVRHVGAFLDRHVTPAPGTVQQLEALLNRRDHELRDGGSAEQLGAAVLEALSMAPFRTSDGVLATFERDWSTVTEMKFRNAWRLPRSEQLLVRATVRARSTMTAQFLNAMLTGRVLEDPAASSWAPVLTPIDEWSDVDFQFLFSSVDALPREADAIEIMSVTRLRPAISGQSPGT